MTEVIDHGESLEYRARRQRRATVTIAVVLLAMAGAFYYASSYFRDTAPKPGACTTEVPELSLTPADVTLNVYNATARKGLALSVSRLAAQRGFKIKQVSNDPLKKAVKGVAQLRYGPTGELSARLLASHTPGVAFVKDKRTDDTVDLVVGNAWKAFGPAPSPVTATQTLRQCPTITVEG